jgi:parallel beta-helix repeat protein
VTSLTIQMGGTLPPVPDGLAAGTITLQQAINAASSGSAFGVPYRTYNERVTVNKPLSLVGVGGVPIITGASLTTPSQQGVLTAAANDVNLTDLRATGASAGCGFDITGAYNRVMLLRVELDGNQQAGYHVTGAADILFDSCYIHHNNANLAVDPLWEAGGGKTTNSLRVNFRNCESAYNGGVGIWWDINGDQCVVENCRVHHNTHAGIMFEISEGAAIRNNSLWENGWGDNRGWGWQSNILISSAKDAVATGNTSAWAAVGIALVSQNRGDFTKPHSGNSATGNFLRVSAGRTGVNNYIDWADPAPVPVISPNTNPASAAQLAAAGIPAAPEAGH